MNGQVLAYVAQAGLMAGAWIAVGVFFRKLWDRSRHSERRNVEHHHD